MEEQTRYEKARKRAEELGEFYQHLLTYVVVNIFLLFVNLWTSTSYLWIFWPLAGWGVGLVLHGISVFGGTRFWGSEWREQKTRELMAEEEHRTGINTPE